MYPQQKITRHSAEIALAARIVHAMKEAHALQKGAVGLDGQMIDAPMIKQVSGSQVVRRWEVLIERIGGKNYSNRRVCWFRNPHSLTSALVLRGFQQGLALSFAHT